MQQMLKQQIELVSQSLNVHSWH